MGNIKLKNLLRENMRRFGTKNLNESTTSITTVGELLQMIYRIPSNVAIALNYDFNNGETLSRSLNYIDTEGLDDEEPQIILVGEKLDSAMTVGVLRSKLSKLDSSTYVTLNIDNGPEAHVVDGISIDTEGLDNDDPEIILYGTSK